MKLETQEQLEAFLDSTDQRLKAYLNRLKDCEVSVHELTSAVKALKLQHALGYKLRGRQRGRPAAHGQKPKTVAQLKGECPRMTKLRPQDYVVTNESIMKDG